MGMKRLLLMLLAPLLLWGCGREVSASALAAEPTPPAPRMADATLAPPQTIVVASQTPARWIS